MDIQVQKREIFGKKVKSLRNEGLIPAELYGHKLENVHLSVAEKDLSKTYKEAGESTVINLIFDSKKIPSLIYYIDVNPISGKFSHVDFYAVKMDEKIRTEVPLNFIGESPAVKGGGILVKSMHEIEIEALPADLPNHIDVDLSGLVEIHNTIHVGDLKIGNKIKILVEPETAVATVIEPVKEEVVEKPLTVEEVKVEGEEKKKEKEKEMTKEAEASK
ncbi:50S ribosomal protein L25 [Candidatus Wolfebacteria bacterium]|nr:50S ribosomal protein L25 [Candidatus Wolfebacteria bacterium]